MPYPNRTPEEIAYYNQTGMWPYSALTPQQQAEYYSFYQRITPTGQTGGTQWTGTPGGAPPVPTAAQTQQQTQALTTQFQAQQATQAQNLQMLNSYKSDSGYDLVKVMGSGDQQAITAAKQTFQPDDIRYAEYAARPAFDISTPEKSDNWEKLTDKQKSHLRPVRDVDILEYNRMSDFEKLGVKRIVGKEVSAQVYAGLGKGAKDYATPKLKWHEQLTLAKEEEGERVSAKTFTLQIGEAIVPFMYTTRHWGEMADWEKGINVFADTVFTVAYLGTAKVLAKGLTTKLTTPMSKPLARIPEPIAETLIPKTMTPTKQAQAEYKALHDMAVEAGRARTDLRLKIQGVIGAENVGIMPKNMPLPKNAVQRALMDNLESATQRSMKADLKFGDSFPHATKLNTKQLTKLEQKSGFQGLSKSVKDIAKTENELKLAWKDFQSTRIPKGELGWWGKLNDIEALHTKLEKQYAYYERVVHPSPPHEPRISTGLPRPENSITLRRAWGKLKGQDVTHRLPHHEEIISIEKSGARKLHYDYAGKEVADKDLYELKKLYRTGKLSDAEQEALGREIALFEKSLKNGEVEFELLEARLNALKHIELKKGKPPEPETKPTKGKTPATPSEKQATKQRMEEFIKSEAKKVSEQERGPQQERFWETESKTTVATAIKEQTATEEELARLFEVKKKAEERALHELLYKSKTKVPKVEGEEPKFGMKPKPKFTPSARNIPQEVRGRRTFAQIAREYSDQAVEDAIGKPIQDLSTKSDLKTAQEVNLQYQNALQGALGTAVNTFTQAYTKSGNKTEAWTEAQAKVQTELQTKTELKVEVKTATQEAVRDIFRDYIFKPRPPLPKPLPGGDNKLEIEHVEGIPANPGIIEWNRGINQVEIHPPYREGSQDIHFELLKKAQKGKGSQEATLKVRGGQAPNLVVLGRQGGIAKTSIYKGRRMVHTRQRGPGILTSSGKFHRQKRGSLI